MGWHVFFLVMFFVQPISGHDMPALNAYLYWGEMAPTFFLIICCVILMIRVDFVVKSPEELERLELEQIAREQNEKEEQKWRDEKQKELDNVEI